MDKETDEIIGKRLQQFMRDTRAAKRLTQRDCAARSGVPMSTWGTYESQGNGKPDPATFLAIAKGLQVSTIELLRAIEGKRQRSDTAAILFNLFDDLSADAQGMVLEWLTMPDQQRRQVEAGLSALLAALRQTPERP